jgi:hypothetical protein
VSVEQEEGGNGGDRNLPQHARAEEIDRRLVTISQPDFVELGNRRSEIHSIDDGAKRGSLVLRSLTHGRQT